MKSHAIQHGIQINRTKMGKPSGLKYNASSILPSNKESTDRVEPQDGQGIDNIFLIKQLEEDASVLFVVLFQYIQPFPTKLNIIMMP